MKFIEKVGNIEVFTQEHGNDIEVIFINGSDIVARETYLSGSEKRAIEDLFRKMDIYTEEWIWLMVENAERISENTYKYGKMDWFCRINNTRYFQHFCKEAESFVKDKNGKRVIDK